VLDLDGDLTQLARKQRQILFDDGNKLISIDCLHYHYVYFFCCLTLAIHWFSQQLHNTVGKTNEMPTLGDKRNIHTDKVTSLR